MTEEACCCAACHAPPRTHLCCPGWFVNSETNAIERCDECALFEDDDAARAHAQRWSLLPADIER